MHLKLPPFIKARLTVQKHNGGSEVLDNMIIAAKIALQSNC